MAWPMPHGRTKWATLSCAAYARGLLASMLAEEAVARPAKLATFNQSGQIVLGDQLNVAGTMSITQHAAALIDVTVPTRLRRRTNGLRSFNG